MSDGTINAAQGTRGGLSGAPARQFKRTRNGELLPVPEVSAQFVLAAGGSVVSCTAGGGGYGPPMSRDPERVRHDAREGWISAERAREVYGVVIDEEGKVNITHTAARRSGAGGVEDR